MDGKKIDEKNLDNTSVLAYSTVEAANLLNAKAIVVSTISGYTARRVSGYRPNCPIIVTTPESSTATSLSLNWGVVPIVVKKFGSTDDIIENAKEQVVKMLDIKEGDKIIITGGFPIKKTRSTNFMKIENL